MKARKTRKITVLQQLSDRDLLRKKYPAQGGEKPLDGEAPGRMEIVEKIAGARGAMERVF